MYNLEKYFPNFDGVWKGKIEENIKDLTIKLNKKENEKEINKIKNKNPPKRMWKWKCK